MAAGMTPLRIPAWLTRHPRSHGLCYGRGDVHGRCYLCFAGIQGRRVGGRDMAESYRRSEVRSA